jgi:Leucine-rich repeat (LRR) protein
MTRDSKLPKTNSLLPSTIYKQFIALIILLLVTSSTQSPSAKYECPSSCECNEVNFSARCDDLDELLSSYSRKEHKSRHNFMPIKSLDLSNNQFTKLTNQLELLVNLTELNLSHNQLTQVHKLNFDRLEKLDLSHNRITSAKLKKLPKNVIHLNLAYNEITYLPVDFMKLKKLRSLELVGNPLNCTCNTLHVRNWITLQHVWSDHHILCASPLTGNNFFC